MKFEYQLLNSKGNKVKGLDNAMWLLVGTDLKAEPRTIGNRDKSASAPALRAFMDTVVYERYAHKLTKPTMHLYDWVDVNEPEIPNAGAQQVDTSDGFKTWMQVSVYSGTKTLSRFNKDPQFPDGPRLRNIKHARIKILLEDMAAGGFCHKLYVAHIRRYLEEGLFIGQMLLAVEGKVDDARQIRDDKIAKRTGTRNASYDIRQSKDNGNFAQVQQQLEEAGGLPEVEAEVLANGGETPTNGNGRELLMEDYSSGSQINMYDMAPGRYDLRRYATPLSWDWDGDSPDRVGEWTIFAQSPGYKVDLVLNS